VGNSSPSWLNVCTTARAEPLLAKVANGWPAPAGRRCRGRARRCRRGHRRARPAAPPEARRAAPWTSWTGCRPTILRLPQGGGLAQGTRHPRRSDRRLDRRLPHRTPPPVARLPHPRRVPRRGARLNLCNPGSLKCQPPTGPLHLDQRSWPGGPPADDGASPAGTARHPGDGLKCLGDPTRGRLATALTGLTGLGCVGTEHRAGSPLSVEPDRLAAPSQPDPGGSCHHPYRPPSSRCASS
jgi:hypothetical protein